MAKKWYYIMILWLGLLPYASYGSSMSKCKGLFQTRIVNTVPNKLLKLHQKKHVLPRPYQLKKTVLFDTIPMDEFASLTHWRDFLIQESIIVHDPLDSTLPFPFKQTKQNHHTKGFESTWISKIASHKKSVETHLAELQNLIQIININNFYGDDFKTIERIMNNYKKMIQTNLLIDVSLTEREFLILKLRQTIRSTSKTLAHKKKINQIAHQVWEEDTKLKKQQVSSNDVLIDLFHLERRENFILFTGMIIAFHLDYLYELRLENKINKSQEIQRVNNIIEDAMGLREEQFRLFRLELESLEDPMEFFGKDILHNIKKVNDRLKSRHTRLNQLHAIDILLPLQLPQKELPKKHILDQPFKKRM